MEGAYPRSVSAVQVGSYFVRQHYQVLHQQPDLVHQFYSDASSMIRVDGDFKESASSMLELHTLIILLNFTAIEIKIVNSLVSWNGGVLVMLSGSVKTKEFSGRRKFVQTFLLAPQEKGYFILNDLFQHPPPIQLKASLTPNIVLLAPFQRHQERDALEAIIRWMPPGAILVVGAWQRGAAKMISSTTGCKGTDLCRGVRDKLILKFACGVISIYAKPFSALSYFNGLLAFAVSERKDVLIL